MLIRAIASSLLSAAFIRQGVESLRNPKQAADAARPMLEGLQALPDPVGSKIPRDAETFAKVNAAIQIGGAALLATGKMPRVASAVLACTVVPGKLGAHMFWSESDPERKAQQRREFLVDLSLLGGLIITSDGAAGKLLLGRRGRGAAGPTKGALPQAGSSAAARRRK